MLVLDRSLFNRPASKFLRYCLPRPTRLCMAPFSDHARWFPHPMGSYGQSSRTCFGIGLWFHNGESNRKVQTFDAPEQEVRSDWISWWCRSTLLRWGGQQCRAWMHKDSPFDLRRHMEQTLASTTLATCWFLDTGQLPFFHFPQRHIVHRWPWSAERWDCSGWKE